MERDWIASPDEAAALLAALPKVNLGAAGLRPITLHQCRHTFASLCIAAGGRAMSAGRRIVPGKCPWAYMGHVCIATVRRPIRPRYRAVGSPVTTAIQQPTPSISEAVAPVSDVNAAVWTPSVFGQRIPTVIGLRTFKTGPAANRRRVPPAPRRTKSAAGNQREMKSRKM